ncbi:XRE family transcriptional regulator, partial [Streptomyces clavifer]
ATDQELQNIAAEGLQEIYFKDGGRRAAGLLVEYTDLEHIQFDL